MPLVYPLPPQTSVYPERQTRLRLDLKLLWTRALAREIFHTLSSSQPCLGEWGMDAREPISMFARDGSERWSCCLPSFSFSLSPLGLRKLIPLSRFPCCPLPMWIWGEAMKTSRLKGKVEEAFSRQAPPVQLSALEDHRERSRVR